MNDYLRRYRWQRGFGLVLASLLLVSFAAMAQPGQAAARADVAVTLWPTPSLQVPPGSVLSYEMRLKNYGEGEASRVEVTLPYDPHVLSLIDASFEDERDWVSEVTRSDVEVTFLEMEANDERTAHLFFRVADTVPFGTVIPMWAGFAWENEREDEEGKLSNAAPVLVDEAAKDSPDIVLMVEPERGPRGTVFTFYSDRYGPGEELSGWLNTTTLPKELSLELESDPHGHIWFSLSSHDLPPGPYSLVLHGRRSDLNGVGAFIVE
jgi:hypothetical protein